MVNLNLLLVRTHVCYKRIREFSEMNNESYGQSKKREWRMREDHHREIAVHLLLSFFFFCPVQPVVACIIALGFISNQRWRVFLFLSLFRLFTLTLLSFTLFVHIWASVVLVQSLRAIFRDSSLVLSRCKVFFVFLFFFFFSTSKTIFLPFFRQVR